MTPGLTVRRLQSHAYMPNIVAALLSCVLRVPWTAASRTRRPSIHREPAGAVEIARHYIRDIIFGANDGLITTFAVVAGVTGGALSPKAVLVVGIANLLADGLSMGVGNYLSIRSHESARAAQDLPEEEAAPARHGAATFVAFAIAGALPLLPYTCGAPPELRFGLSVGATFTALFVIGSLRSLVTVDGWVTAGLEMLLLGVLVAAVAYGSGALVAWLLTNPPRGATHFLTTLAHG